jgi:hypothetical protein
LPFRTWRVEVGDFEAGEFAAADAAAVKEFEDGSVSDAEGVADVGEVEDLSYLVETEGLFGEPLLRARELDFTGGVREDEVLLGKVFEEVAQGAQAGTLGADAEGLAVGFAVAPEVALVAFEDGFCDLVGLVEIAVVGPEEEGF